MKIETKFDIGQKVYFNKSLIYYVDGKDKIISATITGIMFNKTFTWYEIENKDRLLEQHLFSNKQEAEQKLKEMQ